ncbi:hypothetical protein, partial [Streptomyces endocoffeicus]|uniref:hypothetical protein n=1 Tax=Streptomyces endocoffeicus TaxID=2898945 RepID=UPI001E63BF2F
MSATHAYSANRTTLPEAIARTGVVAVLRDPQWSGHEPVVTTPAENGVLAIELTMTTAEALRALPGATGGAGGVRSR